MDSEPYESLSEEPEERKHDHGYHQVADKVGLVPNVRMKDNLIQGITCLTFALLAGLVGGVTTGHGMGILSGCLLGLIIGGFVSGGALMVIGLFRR